MDFSYFKFMNYINKHKKIDWIDLTIDFKISKSEAREIVKRLRENGYISSVGDTGYLPTIKGKNFILDYFMRWLGINLIAILALIVSIIALIRTF